MLLVNGLKSQQHHDVLSNSCVFHDAGEIFGTRTISKYRNHNGCVSSGGECTFTLPDFMSPSAMANPPVSWSAVTIMSVSPSLAANSNAFPIERSKSSISFTI